MFEYHQPVTNLFRECNCGESEFQTSQETFHLPEDSKSNLICCSVVLYVCYLLSHILIDSCDKLGAFLINILQTLGILVLTWNLYIIIDDVNIFLSWYTKTAVLICVLDELTIHMIINMMVDDSTDNDNESTAARNEQRILVTSSWPAWWCMNTIWSLMRDMRLTMQAWILATNLIFLWPATKSLASAVVNLTVAWKPLQAWFSAGKLIVIIEFKLIAIYFFTLYQFVQRPKLQNFILYFEHIEFLLTVVLFRYLLL